MAGKTTIEWTHAPGYEGGVWNPTTGCTRVSAGCDNCYAFALHDKRFASNLATAKAAGAHRMNAIAQLTDPVTIIARARTFGGRLPWPKQYDTPFSRVQLLEDRLDVPLRTKKPTCYFVDSMADLFHEDVPDEFIGRVWVSMQEAPRHRFLILTKRPERMRRWIAATTEYRDVLGLRFDQWPLPNVWLGTSVEDQKAADERIPQLLATPAAVRFLSCEPLLGPVDLTRHLLHPSSCGGQYEGMGFVDGAQQRHRARCVNHGDRLVETTVRHGPYEYVDRIDWVIVGGESGSRARPMDLAWARSLVAQCRAAGVAPFVKQLGSRVVGEAGDVFPDGVRLEARYAMGFSKVRWLLRESHGRDMAEWPEDLRVREWPR